MISFKFLTSFRRGFFSVLTREKAQPGNIWDLQVWASSVKMIPYDNQGPNLSIKHCNVLFTQHSMKFVFHKEIKLHVKVCDVLNTTGCPRIFLKVIFDDFIRKLKLFLMEQV